MDENTPHQTSGLRGHLNTGADISVHIRTRMDMYSHIHHMNYIYTYVFRFMLRTNPYSKNEMQEGGSV